MSIIFSVILQRGLFGCRNSYGQLIEEGKELSQVTADDGNEHNGA